MTYTNPDISDFKEYFTRDFPYSNVWVSGTVYNQNDIVFYSVSGFFYKALKTTVSSAPTTTADWAKTSDISLNFVMDSDITKALNEAGIVINSALFFTQDEYSTAYCYLAAHYLCADLLASSQGINSQFSWLTTAKTVGNVSESYGLPERVLKNPYLSYLTTTRYGAKYISLIINRLIGGVYVSTGTTTSA